MPKPANLEPWDSPPTPHGFKGGDLLGVVERLDYLTDLGITALYFTPVFQSASNHRYHTHDYYRVDPILGGDGALRALLDAAHACGIRVVLDGVFNHASRGFFQFHHLLECGERSPYVDWFSVDAFPLNAYDWKAFADGARPNYRAWADMPALPKLNTETPAVREFLFGVAEHWIRFGIDGWRLDVPQEIDDPAFWREFRRRVKGANPDAYIVGEIWEPAPRWLEGDQLDAVMNYVLARPTIGFFGASRLSGLRHGPYRIQAMDAARFAQEVEHAMGLYDWQVVQAQLNLLGSHDTPRFLTMVGGDQTALQLAVLCQMTLPGAPCVYYGDELGLTGGYDPACRSAMPWERLAEHQGDIWRTTKAAIALRKAHPVLRRGTYRTVLAAGDLLAYRRDLNGSLALVAFNAGMADAPVALPVDGPPLQVAYGAPEAFTQADGQVSMVIPARSGVVLVSDEQS